ncbi:MAG: WD40 repeat domain-containing protein [Luteolibacter sp.]|uniref:WD40 repeat domain-containing protein n=1 Tax=Luteolibacter sp. TaxID=1962973 RepID=UPI0032671DBA
MNLSSTFRATFAILVASGLQAGAALENRVESLGPLKRYDPYADSPQFLVKTHGNPRLGLLSAAGDRLQRVSDRNWYLELNGCMARMEPDYKTGEVVLKEVIDISRQWCVSSDGKLIFGSRSSEKHGQINECFDLATGESKWTFEKTLNAMATCFTPDGSQVAILHKSPNPQPKIPPGTRPESLNFDSIRKMTPPVSAEVSWYDAKSGELARRVVIPGSSGGSSGAFLAFSGDRLYVARPGDDTGGECFVIKVGATEPEKIEVEALGGEEETRVAVGGLHGEFVTFYSDNNVVLFRQEADGALTKLDELELEGTSEGNSYDWSARFTPDGTQLVISSCWKAIFIPTGGSAGAEHKEFLQSSHLSDFSEDGKFFVSFNDGGGKVRNATSWEVVESFDSKIHPPHCCPITEAGFSMSGNYIVSCDEVRLLLWSKDGVELAELYSARTDANQAVRMQSPVILEDQGKIYAADGYDFLVWDLEALHKRLSRKPDNIPRVKGEVVFRDRKQENKSPELMNIRIDAKGENIITATRSVVRYRPLEASAPIVVPVPKDDIFMNPRSFMAGTSDSSVIVCVGYDSFRLDLAGKEQPVTLGRSIIASGFTDSLVFSVNAGARGGVFQSYPPGNPKETTDIVSLSDNWYLRPENAMLSPDRRWIVLIPGILNNKGSTLAVIDVAKRQMIHSQPLSWRATSLSLSEDGKRLLVGSANRAVYEFDFQKMTESK